MNQAYSLHTPLAISTALRRGLNTVDHPHRAGPFYLLLPMNIQALIMKQFQSGRITGWCSPTMGAAADNGNYDQALQKPFSKPKKSLVRLGGGAMDAGKEISELVGFGGWGGHTSPVASGVIPYHHARNMSVAGYKGSISGNFAMENADLLIAIGSRFVCQSDCSRTGFLNVQQVININTDLDSATHYGKTMAFVGDASPTLRYYLHR